MKTIILATPHARYDVLEQAIVAELSEYRVVRLRLKEELSVGRLEELNPEYVFFPHWSWLIPRQIHARFDCVVFHMTDLPYGRGGSPLQNLIVRGLKMTRLTALKCEAEIDTGPVYLKGELSLDGTAEQIFARAGSLMREMILEIVRNRTTPLSQVGIVETFERRTPEQSNLIDSKTLDQVYDHIRMLDADGYPPAFLEIGSLRIEFKSASRRQSSVDATATIRVLKHE